MKTIYDYLYNIYISYLRWRGCRKEWKHHTHNVKLRMLTTEQKKSIKLYYKRLTGENVSTRWHQLLYSLTGVFNISYLPFEVYSTVIGHSIVPKWSFKTVLDDKNIYRFLLKGFVLPERVIECCHGVYTIPADANRGGVYN